jgi:phage-related protein
MFNTWNVEYYKAPSGNRPVEEFLDSLDTKSQAKIARTLDLLEEFGNKLGMPYARHLEKQLWELRVRQSRNRYRIIYFLAKPEKFVLLHGFTKKTAAVLRTDIDLARHRMDDYLSRRNTE